MIDHRFILGITTRKKNQGSVPAISQHMVFSTSLMISETVAHCAIHGLFSMSGSLVAFNQELSLGFILGGTSINGATSLPSLPSLAAFIPLRMSFLLGPHLENCQGLS